VDDVYVVVGAHAERIQAALDLSGVTVVLNADWPLGQLSSLQAGLRAAADGGYDAVIMALVDHPLIHAATVDAIGAAFAATDRPIVVPVHDGRRGHPVLFAARLVPELLAAPLDQGARVVVHAHAAEVLEVESPAPGILADIDTPALYQEWVGGTPPTAPPSG
jgi:molybdenum cofactor cytidylyltransferase